MRDDNGQTTGRSGRSRAVGCLVCANVILVDVILFGGIRCSRSISGSHAGIVLIITTGIVLVLLLGGLAVDGFIEGYPILNGCHDVSDDSLDVSLIPCGCVGLLHSWKTDGISRLPKISSTRQRIPFHDPDGSLC